jgi:undecaprenyl-diphosphatase
MPEIIAWLEGVDRSVFAFINQSLANPVTDFIMPLVTLDLHLKIFYGAVLLILLWRGDNRLRLSIILSLIVVLLTDQLSAAWLKSVFVRPRPCHDMEVHLLVNCGSGFSLPSSHAANLFGQAFFYRVVAPKSWIYLVPLAVVVALSRVFVGVHYPFDILVGAALGIIIGHFVGVIFDKLFPRDRRGKEEKHIKLSDFKEK